MANKSGYYDCIAQLFVPIKTIGGIMKSVLRRGFVFLGALAVFAAWGPLGHCDDSPTPAWSVLNLLQAPTAPGGGAGPATAPAAPGPGDQANPAPPDFNPNPSREESPISSNVPDEIGDMGGGPVLTVSVPGKVTGGRFETTRFVPSPGNGILGAQRFADNDCTLPMDRIFSDYSFFHNAQLASPTDANRFVPGFEKTFFNGNMSVEMRFPLGVLESNSFDVGSPIAGMTGQFGNIQLIVKGLLVRNNSWTLGAGIDVSIPTAPEIDLTSGGVPEMRIDNSSTHLLPYVGLLVTPNDDWFAEAFLQVDVATSGDAVAANLTGAGLVPLGSVYEQNLVFADFRLGRWMYRNSCQWFSGVAGVVEAHYTGGLNAPSALQAGGFSAGYNTAEYNVLDMVIGGHAVFGSTTVTAGFATPVTSDRAFDGEFRLFVNRQF
jgi:hypothetical protein